MANIGILSIEREPAEPLTKRQADEVKGRVWNCMGGLVASHPQYVGIYDAICADVDEMTVKDKEAPDAS